MVFWGAMTSKPRPTIEGFTVAELVALDDFHALVLVGAPILFKVGEAELLGQFSLENTTLIAELGVAEGGGDGTLLTLIDAIKQSARRQALTAIDWRIYAVDCPSPNPKLIRVLEGYCFQREQIESGAIVYRRRTSLNDTLIRRR